MGPVGRRNSSQSQGARSSAWNLPEGLVSIGSPVLFTLFTPRTQLCPFSSWQFEEVRSQNA